MAPTADWASSWACRKQTMPVMWRTGKTAGVALDIKSLGPKFELLRIGLVHDSLLFAGCTCRRLAYLAVVYQS